MTPYIIDLDKYPDLQFRIDTFSVPAAPRAEFEATMQRSLAFIRTLNGFRWHLVFEKTSDGSTFNLVTMAAWDSPDAIEKAVAAVQAYYTRSFAPEPNAPEWPSG